MAHPVRLYNSLTRTVEPLQPFTPGTVTIYACGPTVYDDPHIGHARSALVFDVLVRFLETRGYQVRFVRNVTDVDDKIIEKARQELGPGERDLELARACEDVAGRYLRRYHEAMDRLGIRRPTAEPRATEHVVPGMTDLIATLLMRGEAYEAPSGATDRDVYFAVRRFPDYGKLSNRTPDDLLAGARVEPGEHKQDPLDFALWKAAKPGEPSWKSPWGQGRPGWHIECTAMSTALLGDTFDIHGGGVDLIFPHHENELAQALGAGKPFARRWVHHGLLTVNGEKMSKSVGNVVSVADALAACQDRPDALKVFSLGAQYRSPIDYTAANLAGAVGRLDRWLAVLYRADVKRPGCSQPAEPPPAVAALEDAFARAMADDLNTPEALAALDQLAGHAHRLERGARPSARDAAGEPKVLDGEYVCAADTIRRLGSVLGLWSSYRALELSARQQRRLQDREAARQRKDFETADAIRNEFAAAGLQIEDTQHGPIVRPTR